MEETLALWHRSVKEKTTAYFDDLFAEDCVFLSPIVHTPQEGKELTKLYLSGAVAVLAGDFRYIKEVVDGNHAVLEFISIVDGLKVNGVDIITFNEHGRICEFKVMLRPLKAVNLMHAKMHEMLQQLSA